MNKLKVLLADDHEGFRKNVADFLSKQEGVEIVAEASDGNEAVEQAEEFHPDLVLMDVSMPCQNGIEATKAIKRRFPATKVFILSFYAPDHYGAVAEQSCVDGFLDKAKAKNALLSLLHQHYSNSAMQVHLAAA